MRLAPKNKYLAIAASSLAMNGAVAIFLMGASAAIGIEAGLLLFSPPTHGSLACAAFFLSATFDQHGERTKLQKIKTASSLISAMSISLTGITLSSIAISADHPGNIPMQKIPLETRVASYIVSFGLNITFLLASMAFSAIQLGLCSFCLWLKTPYTKDETIFINTSSSNQPRSALASDLEIITTF